VCRAFGKRKRAVIVHRSAQGAYSNGDSGPAPGDTHHELDPRPVPVRIDIAPLASVPPTPVDRALSTGSRQVTR